MYVLFISDNFPPESNAPASRLWEHAIRWVRDGHEVTVVTGAPNFPEGKVYSGYSNAWRAIEYLQGIRVVRVKTYIAANEGFVKRTLDYLSFMVTAFLAALFEGRPDVIVATSPQFFSAVGGWALSVVKRRPFVFELRDLWPASITAVGAVRWRFVVSMLERLELFLYRRAHRIVAVTNSFKADLVRRGIPARKIDVVRNGVDLSVFSPRAKDVELVAEYDLDGKFVVGYIGTHGLAHALPSVLVAAERLKARENIVLVFAGAGAERERVERAVSERALSNVRLIPRQPKERMPALWSVCDVALVPLKNDPVFATVIPSKIFEAMGMGVPVVCCMPAGEATDIVAQGEVGVCVEPEHPAALAEAIVELSEAPNRVRSMRLRAEEAAQQYSREGTAEKMLQVFAHALS